MNRPELPYLLLIQAEQASQRVRDALAFNSGELVALLERAAQLGAPLAIVVYADGLALLSTETGRVSAFRPVLERLRERSLEIDGLGALRVRGLQGGDVARWLVQQSCGLERAGLDFLATLHGAAALAARAGTLVCALSDLVYLCERARSRVRSETRLASAGATRAEAELELLAAERIVEEEIVDWQTDAPEQRASSVRVPELGEYSPEEAHSAVRLRVARVLDKLGVA